MPATLTPPTETKDALQARLAAIEAEERRLETIENSRRRLQNGVATAETRLSRMKDFVERVKVDLAERWAQVDRRIATPNEILGTGQMGNHTVPELHPGPQSDYAAAVWQSHRLSRADELWVKPCETALENARAELAAFEKSNPAK